MPEFDFVELLVLCRPTVGISRAATFALGLSLQDTLHNQIEPRYNRRDSGVGFMPG